MSLTLSAIMFVSGAAALVFETLWFRQAGLAFGNSVWASSLVLSSFMAGLALGNALVARFGARIRKPLRLYALLEVAIAIGGVLLVWVLPHLAAGLAPLWRPFLDRPWILNPLRLGIGFGLLVLPATAMGATLPVLVKALRARDPNFGSVLGRLYGWNTLGAVVGAVSGEALLLHSLGVAGSAYLAGGLDLLAAAAALTVSLRFRRTPPGQVLRGPVERRRLSADAWRLLAASFLAGAILLSLEVVWFRFLQLFVRNSSLSFAVMLAVVLSGIGLGGRLAGLALRRRAEDDWLAAPTALLAGAAALLTYQTFARVIAPFGSGVVLGAAEVLQLSATLMFPVSLLSGALFTFTGTALHRQAPPDTRATGLLTLANTLGGGLGALAGGFALLPLLGIAGSMVLLTAIYGGVALLLFGIGSGSTTRARRGVHLACLAALALALLTSVSQALSRDYYGIVERRFHFGPETEVAALRETRTETLLLLRSTLKGEPLHYLLVTGGFGMAATDVWSRRYMKQFVHLPLILNPDTESALLISYGTGSTAQALTAAPSLRRIDVVDISRDILELSDVVYPSPLDNPLRDWRVRSHVDDGRFFLLTSEDRYDLITSEPPPPKHVGVVSLYTREYFALVYERLTEGGLNTHWLPVHALTLSDAKAIVRAYCEVFADCSLWSGMGSNWILLGSRRGDPGSAAGELARRWEAFARVREGRALGLERVEQLGATFIDDAQGLRATTRDVPPLVDAFPKRLTDRLPDDQDRRALREWMDPGAAQERFRNSPFIERTWPPDLRRSTLAHFEHQRLINELFWHEHGRPVDAGRSLPLIHALLTESDLETLPLWFLNANEDALVAVDRLRARRRFSSALRPLLGARALARREFEPAARHFAATPTLDAREQEARLLEAYALAMARRVEEAAQIARRQLARLGPGRAEREPWVWLLDTFADGEPATPGHPEVPTDASGHHR